MFDSKATKKCRVVKKITERGVFRCLQPATVFLIRHTPEPYAVCVNCARELALEIMESVPGGRRDVNREPR
jgi:hypothetical protein